jgi:hypothetical protein
LKIGQSKVEVMGILYLGNFMEQRKKYLDKQIIIFWFANKCIEDNEGKYGKTCKTLWGEFSKKNKGMVVLEGDEVQGKPFKNFIVEKPHNIFFKDKNNLILGLCQHLSKINPTYDVKIFLVSFMIEGIINRLKTSYNY